jgi:hypothetical protein
MEQPIGSRSVRDRSGVAADRIDRAARRTRSTRAGMTAERGGFEPPRPVRAYSLSRRAPSTTRTPLRGRLSARAPGPGRDPIRLAQVTAAGPPSSRIIGRPGEGLEGPWVRRARGRAFGLAVPRSRILMAVPAEPKGRATGPHWGRQWTHGFAAISCQRTSELGGHGSATRKPGETARPNVKPRCVARVLHTGAGKREPDMHTDSCTRATAHRPA